MKTNRWSVQCLLSGLYCLERWLKKCMSLPWSPILIYAKINIDYTLIRSITLKPLTVYLKQEDRQNYSSNSVHQPHVIVDQGFSATTNEDVEFFSLVVVVVVGSVVGDFVLDTGSGRTRVTATKGHTINQVTAIHIAFNAAGRLRRKWIKKKKPWIIANCYEIVAHKVTNSLLKTFLLHAFDFIVLTQKITGHQPRHFWHQILTWFLNAFL